MVTFFYCRTSWFGPSRTVSQFGTLASADFSRLALLRVSEKKSRLHVRETSRGKTITFIPYIRIIYSTASG